MRISLLRNSQTPPLLDLYQVKGTALTKQLLLGGGRQTSRGGSKIKVLGYKEEYFLYCSIKSVEFFVVVVFVGFGGAELGQGFSV